MFYTIFIKERNENLRKFFASNGKRHYDAVRPFIGNAKRVWYQQRDRQAIVVESDTPVENGHEFEGLHEAVLFAQNHRILV